MTWHADTWQVDPEKRLSASDALSMLPNVEKVVPTMPTTGELLLPAAAAGASETAPAKRAGERPAKKSKAAHGEASTDTLTPSKICHLLGAVNPQTSADAEHLWRRSEAARARGLAGAATCALIACKISETETFSVDDVSELPALADSGSDLLEDYSELELEVLNSVGFAVISCTAVASATERA